jgi:hypothetical protein
MKKAFYLLVLLNSVVIGQRADFFKEDITFRLDSSYMNVEGYYWFSNHSDKPILSDIYYPFSYDTGQQIDSINIFNISIGQETRFKKESKYGISFPLRLAPLDTVLLKIKYKQNLNADSAIYILKTTQFWGKPIDHAEYKLITPISLYIKKFTYPPDKTYEIEKLRIYYWKRNNFMPVQDMIFYFR